MSRRGRGSCMGNLKSEGSMGRSRQWRGRSSLGLAKGKELPRCEAWFAVTPISMSVHFPISVTCSGEAAERMAGSPAGSVGGGLSCWDRASLAIKPLVQVAGEELSLGAIPPSKQEAVGWAVEGRPLETHADCYQNAQEGRPSMPISHCLSPSR